ncbi:cation diffusion facilitator family transporter [Nocardioides sp.]|uniref:cation diffusion facilitator family transporter n=1 Tax=Nocardioides sp. TaxID=35761 RepID=UPI002736BD2A|nr:cation diffusion facilitator family transporter [Nocardioides sp.]MDP3893600.1 cation diffusion facilitator family transporter [Nocardioides sp.]
MSDNHGHDDVGHGHGHGHDVHGHEHEHARGVRARFREVFRPHSHDAADSVDSALESSAEGIRAVKISLAVLAATALAQAMLVAVTGSVALLADTIHNFADALTAVPLWIAFVIGRRKPTRTYTYGYGRAEDLAGIFIVAMIAISAVVAGYEAINRLIHPADVSYPWVVAAAGLIGFFGNETVAAYRIRVGKRIGSAALVADGYHARTDGFTSLAVLVGALGVIAGFPLADPIIALLITIAILLVLRSAARDIYRRLMDAVDPELTDTALATLRATPGVRDIESVRLRWVGHQIRAEAGIVVDHQLDLLTAHQIAHEAQHNLIHQVPKLVDATVHVSPAPEEGHNPHELLDHHPQPEAVTG